MKLRIKCTVCQRIEEMTEQQLQEAALQGIAFSRCCKAVATAERVEAAVERARRTGHGNDGARRAKSARLTRS